MGDGCISGSHSLHKVRNFPMGVRNPSSHSWSAAKRPVRLHKVVVSKVQGNRGLEVLTLLGKGVRESRETAAMHPQSVVLFLAVLSPLFPRAG